MEDRAGNVGEVRIEGRGRGPGRGLQVGGDFRKSEEESIHQSFFREIDYAYSQGENVCNLYVVSVVNRMDS